MTELLPTTDFNRRQKVFIINDVDLIVPPTNISIQKEDLTYSWKALRTKTTTKIPSGQGQVAIQVSIPFTGSMVLDMHRLIVEFRHSPICYIENRFLRESIVPHWPLWQNMAFTMTGCSVAPMKGSSDTWVMQLDMTWFNYFPYVHNFMYRHDWHTVPLRAVDNPFGFTEPVELTIGWGWDNGQKIPRRVTLPLDPATPGQIEHYSVVKQRYNDKLELSITDMEFLHRGEVFDMQPLPGRMAPAARVAKPADSLIYTRFINLLQRDALKQNFDIDIEEEWNYGTDKQDALWPAFFSAIKDPDDARLRACYGLHSGPKNSKLRRRWARARDRWAQKMNSYHGTGLFSFGTYRELRLPDEWSSTIRSAHKKALRNVRNDLGMGNAGDKKGVWVDQTFTNKDGGTSVAGRFLVRSQFSSADDKFVPIGKPGSDAPMTVGEFADFKVNSHVKWRKLPGEAARAHHGVDLNTVPGTPIFAIEDGKVIEVADGVDNGTVWYRISYDASADGDKLARSPVSGVDDGDFQQSVRAYNPTALFDSRGRPVADSGDLNRAGTVVPSATIPDSFYLLDYVAGGKNIKIESPGGHITVYRHLETINVEYGQQIVAKNKLVLGTTGATSHIDKNLLEDFLYDSDGKPVLDDKVNVLDSTTLVSNPYSRGYHLHLEYWEKLDAPGAVDPAYDFNDGVPQVDASNSRPGMIPVDIMDSYKLGEKSLHFIRIDYNLLKPDPEDIDSYISSELGEEKAQNIMELLSQLWQDDWFYYQEDENVVNVWWKPFRLNIRRGNQEEFESAFLSDHVLMTACAGGLQHVVANIPILGHEFPTQQHLGSVEPFYSFEFCSVDMRGERSNFLSGVSREAELLISMRTLLHSNARRFRQIPDSWAVAGDTFITRLLGSYRSDDVSYLPKVIEEGAGASTNRFVVADDVRLRRRLVNTRGTSVTVPGHPGLTCHTFDFSETNPYEEESLIGSNPDLPLVEDARKKVLNAVFDFAWDQNVKKAAAAVLVAQLAGGQTSDIQGSGYGEYELSNYLLDANGVLDFSGNVGTLDIGGEEYVVFGDKSGVDNEVLKSLLGPSGYTTYNYQGTQYPAIPLSAIDAELLDTVVEDKAVGKAYDGKNSIKQAAPTKSTVYRKLTTRKYSISKMLNEFQQNQILGEVPIDKILDYWHIITDLVVTASMMLSESSSQVQEGRGRLDGSGIGEQEVQQTLYGLPVQPAMFRFFQRYLEAVVPHIARYELDAREVSVSSASAGSAASKAVRDLRRTPNWLYFNEDIEDLEQLVELDPTRNWRAALDVLDLASSSIARGVSASLLGGGGLIRRGLASFDEFFDGKNFQKQLFTDWKAEQYADTNEYIAKLYLRALPITSIALEDRFKEYVTDSTFGPLVGALEAGSDADSPIFANNTSNLKLTVASCGKFVPSPFTAMPLYLVGEDGQQFLVDYEQFLDNEGLLPDLGQKTDENTKGFVKSDKAKAGLAGAASNDKFVPVFFGAYQGFIRVPASQLAKYNTRWKIGSLGHAFAGVQNAFTSINEGDFQNAVSGELGAASDALDKIMLNPDIFAALRFSSGAEGIYPYNSAFSWVVDEGFERTKLEYFKELLARFADDLRRDVSVLRAFGLQELAYLGHTVELQGGPAYPDLDLPPHPYYGSYYTTSPDFYFWNIYEDGDAHNADVREQMRDATNTIIGNAYKSMKSFEAGVIQSPDKDMYSGEPTAMQEPLHVRNQFNAEGTSGSASEFNKGPTAFPFAPSVESVAAIDKHFNEPFGQSAIQKYNNRALTQPTDLDTVGGRTSPKPLGALVFLTEIARDKSRLAGEEAPAIRLSLFESAYGQNGGNLYPLRTTGAKYAELYDKKRALNKMFGSRVGTLEQNPLPPGVMQRLDGTALGSGLQATTHTFSEEGLRQLAENSSNDITGMRKTLRRAYPTFKLYFVEEDEQETRLLSFDDFYSYNNVVNFTVVQSRKSPVDHAVITLLNVAGTLDGTKRDAVTDLDYFGDPDKIKSPGDQAGVLANEAVPAGSAQEQPLGAVVLRPGLNVQLRAGYSNDPRELDVLISGRVVDVTWNMSGDRAEIMVQSFGAELMQAIKGTGLRGNDEIDPAPTTHHLLGSLMLEPELLHFGRWEFGQLYQVGEASDSRLDLFDYSKDGWFGRLSWGGKALQWMVDHPWITGALVIGGGSIFNRIPGLGRLINGAGSVGRRVGGRTGAGLVERFFAKLGVKGASKGTGGWTAALTAEAGAGGAVATAGTRVGAGILRKGFLNWKRSTQRNILYRILASRKNGAELVKAAKEASAASRREAFELLRKNGGKVEIGQLAEILAKGQAREFSLLRKSLWSLNPLNFGWNAETVVGVTGKTVWNVFNAYTMKIPLSIAGVAGAVGLVDGLAGLASPIFKNALNRVKAFFVSRKVSLLLSPQDDNIYAPHPKDYMVFNTEYDLPEKVKSSIVKVGLTAFAPDALDRSTIEKTQRWALGMKPFDKRVKSSECEYVVKNQTIWDVFHEMSLRHPGWVYAARPYGKAFRYTMFFGVPSQRYWSSGANNLFIKRSNDLYRALDSGIGINFDEYRRLYGDVYDDGEQSFDLEYARTQLRVDAEMAVLNQQQANGNILGGNPFDPNDFYDSFGNPVSSTQNYSVVANQADVDRMFAAMEQHLLTPRALEEYLRSVTIRFTPFRRYHIISSDDNLVWNGIMGSENAMYNAVDVTIANEDGNPTESILFKAHAFIPDYKLRVLPMQFSHNVRSYQMASRYGIGQLLHSMKDMYRGEVITLGNNRMRPWDIGILLDGYNDMVGPVEVEQVVHQFSHETGFITEVKPSAVVFSNETSSWPVLEAMKVMTLAVKDIEKSHEGLRADTGGVPYRAIEMLMDYVDESGPYGKHLRERVEELSDTDPFGLEDGSSDLEAIQETADNVEQALDIGVTAMSLPLAWPTVSAALLSGGFGGGYALYKTGSVLNRIAPTTPAGLSLLGDTENVAFSVANMLPSLEWLIGGPILFLSCLKNDSMVVVPLMKNGHPVSPGLPDRDPTMIWNNFKGSLSRWIDDYIGGTKDVTELWKRYGYNAWRRLGDVDEFLEDLPPTDYQQRAYAQLTGEER